MNLALVLSIISGYAGFYYSTHPTSKLWHKIPSIKMSRRVQLTPSIRLFARGRIIHLHHWFTCGVLLLVATYTNAGILDAVLAKGVLIGGVLQGISMPEARRLVYKQTDSWKNFSRD
ncbi:MAG: hypothetical protein A2782_01855 [Candidatus Blackburnbacteria bacterium RIFCSPHIGHO2_01_FULL_43_15b]|uniref:Uncharacterized protein n=1 Tax=Candidatus Blackburnbacteria bacterium RIFCSPHIGHO2_01_FULL_43_15b TaxID=1797513 RepID=A0A1G1V1G4_9BACT|nr:MAG: hypothetical protein A2782_01855 [Candidatus Blackburnbacteria bacterium RIFCSPHIGHO2_01_FULL_43_15b]